MLVKAFSALVLAGVAAAQTALSINTPPSLVQCQPASISWVGGTGPFILAVIPGEQTTAAAIETINDNVASSPYTWTVNIPAGTFITLKITDSTGNNQYSSALTVQAGGSGCLSSSSSASGSATNSAAVVASSGSAASSGASSSAVASSSAASSSAASSSAAASPAVVASSSAARASSSSAPASASSSHASSSAPAAASSSAAAKPSGAALANAFAPIPMALGVFGAVALAL